MRHLTIAALLAATGTLGSPAGAGDRPLQLAMKIEVSAAGSGSGLQLPPSDAPVGAAASPVSAAGSIGTASPVGAAGSAAAPAVDADPAETATTTTPAPVEPPVRKLVIVGWGGGYGKAMRRGILDPYQQNARTKIEVIEAPADGGLPPASVAWDVAEVSAADAKRACEAGQIARLDRLPLAPGAYGTTPDQDFIDGSLGACAVGSFAWSSLLLIDPRQFRKGQPETLADVFDGRRFKQKRAFARSPRYLLEMALMADGVAPDQVYGELSTRVGVRRAFKKLDGIRKWIVWSDKSEVALNRLIKGEAAIATAFSGRAFYALASELRPYQMMWDGQIYDMSVWVISNTTGAEALAEDFVTFATRADRLAAVSRWFPYGPVRLSALELVGKHQTLDVSLSPYLATTPANMTRALAFNELFWRHYEAPLKDSLEAWIDGKDPLPPEPPVRGHQARTD
ncbi:MAG: extracellular solute-binding protein [Hyphomicrobiaceae bacterium]